MEILAQHLKETIDRFDGFITGRLYVEEDLVGLYMSGGTEIKLDDTFLIEVRNGEEYQEVTIQEVLDTKTAEDWHLYAGLYVRIKTKATAPTVTTT